MQTVTRDPRDVYEGVGDVVTRFAQQWIVQTIGRWSGQPLILEPWQRDFLNELFLLYADGSRVYREALLGISRKNGKSTLSAAIALYMLLAAGEASPEVYVAAGSKEQARIVFGQAQRFVENSPRLSDWLKVQKNVIVCPANDGIFRVLAADAGTNYGLNPSGVVIDELHVHKDAEWYYSLTTGQLAREAPLVVSITTAGFDRQTICYDLYERGRRLEREGGLLSMRREAFLFKWFEAPPTATPTDPTGWEAANPSSWITADDLAREQRRLPDNIFRRLHLNQWTEVEDAWIKPYVWDACRGVPVFDPSDDSYIMVDVGIKRDSAAITWGQWHGPELHIGQKILTPEEMGPKFGIDDVRAHVMSEARTHKRLKEIGGDPFMFRESMEIMATAGLPVIEFPQSGRMEPASNILLELANERRLVHDGNEEMRRQVLSAVAAPTERGGWKISKRKSLERIDGAVALAMLADRAVTLRYERPVRRRAAFL
jgi:phage terminase large subunit-like protein